MAGLRPLISSIAVLLLFSLCLFTFMVDYLITNNPTSSILANPTVNSSITSLNNSISAFQEGGQNAQVLLASDEPSATTFLFLIFKSAYYIPISFLGLIGSSVTVFSKFVFVQIFGIGSSPFYLAFAVFNTIIIITAVFLIIKFVRTGEGER